MSDLYSYILVCKDLLKAQEEVNEKYKDKRICTFLKEKTEFLLEDAKSVVKEAYIAESEEKILLLCANSFGIEAQNSLLKILEEPPKNIIFILIVPSKTVLLPTIRSRMRLEDISVKREKIKSSLNLNRLFEKDIFEFVQQNSKLNKIELKQLIQDIVSESVLDFKISFNENELTHFQTLLELAEFNTRGQNILFSLLLTIMKRKRQ